MKRKEICLVLTGLGLGYLLGSAVENKLNKISRDTTVDWLKADNEELKEINETLNNKIKELQQEELKDKIESKNVSKKKKKNQNRK